MKGLVIVALLHMRESEFFVRIKDILFYGSDLVVFEMRYSTSFRGDYFITLESYIDNSET